MKKLIIAFALFAFHFLCCNRVFSATTNSITQQGITFNFDASYEYGQFASGDYWVVGPLTITSITPTFDGSNNGWVVNPSTLTSSQGLDSEVDGFNASLVPSLPYFADTGTGVKSIIKAYSGADGRDLPLDTVVILTVVPTAPIDNGVNAFRPAYFGTDKTYYYTTNINRDLLLNLTPAVGAPSFSTLTTRYAYTRYNQFPSYSSGTLSRFLRPLNSTSWATSDGYQPDLSHHDMAALLMMHCNYDYDTQKKPILIKLLQMGIDECTAALAGWRPPIGGGHEPGHRALTSFTAAILNVSAFKSNLVASASGPWHEETYVKSSSSAGSGYGGLYGEDVSESSYWTYISTGSGGRSTKDPYGYIDGGSSWTAYQLIITPTWGYEELLVTLMPSMLDAWPTGSLSAWRGYSKRAMEYGAWTQPDPCAPYVSGAVYGVDYGPDSDDSPAPCILDEDIDYYNSATDFACQAGKLCGRFPDRHLAQTGIALTSYSNTFADGMWTLYHDYNISSSAPSLVGVSGTFSVH